MASSEVSNSSTKPHENSEAYEEEHVHQVYQQIAQHFSATRYKVRPNFFYLAYTFLFALFRDYYKLLHYWTRFETPFTDLYLIPTAMACSGAVFEGTNSWLYWA